MASHPTCRSPTCVDKHPLGSLGSRVFQTCRGVCWIEVVNCAVKQGGERPQGPGQMTGEESCEPRACRECSGKKGPSVSSVQCGFIEHLLCAWPQSGKARAGSVRPQARPPPGCAPLGKPGSLSGPSLLPGGCGEGQGETTFSTRWLRAREFHPQRFKPLPCPPLGGRWEPLRWLCVEGAWPLALRAEAGGRWGTRSREKVLFPPL